MEPLGVMRPIALAPLSVNQRLPSGPAVMPKAVPEGTLNSVTAPAAAQIPGDFFRVLFSTGGQQNLATTQGKGI
jgi:hypothetical protein